MNDYIVEKSFQITRIIIGLGLLLNVQQTLPTMLLGFDMLYPKKLYNDYNYNYYETKHILPYALTSIIGCYAIVNGIYNIIITDSKM